MEYVQMTINDWLEVKNKLKMELQGVKQSFVRIGYVLRKIDDQRLYENDGYKSIAEFAKEEYGLEASTVSRFMSINREYSIDGYSEHLREEYLEMGRSQLEEMLKLPENDRQMIQPAASREGIRELKRFNKTEPAAGVADDISQLIEKFYEANPDALNAAFTEGSIENLKEIINPSGNKSFKKGMYFLMMYEDNIKIKKFGTDPQTMSWSEFFDITRAIFEVAADGPNTWNNYFGKPEIEQPVTETPPAVTKEPPPITKSSSPTPEEQPPIKNELAADRVEPKEKLSTPEPVPADKKEGEPAGDEVEEIPEEIPVAPAQKFLENLEKTAISESENPVSEVIEKPFGSRKDYMDSLTAYGMAGYLSENKNALINAITSGLTAVEKWLLQTVDENGEAHNE